MSEEVFLDHEGNVVRIEEDSSIFSLLVSLSETIEELVDGLKSFDRETQFSALTTFISLVDIILNGCMLLKYLSSVYERLHGSLSNELPNYYHKIEPYLIVIFIAILDSVLGFCMLYDCARWVKLFCHFIINVTKHFLSDMIFH